MIAIEQLHFAYGKKTLYDHFSLHTQQTGIYGLFGRNGSGKSTLLKLMAGLVFPKKGTITINGFTPALRHPDFLADIYIVPEEFHLPNITMNTMCTTQSRFYPHFNKQQLEQYLDIFSLPSNKLFEDMSLGEKKKSVIAFALASNTQILLMDEPTNGIDILGRSQFKQIMQLHKNDRRMVFISTHQAHDLDTLVDHVVFVDEGKLALSASMHTLQHQLRMGTCADITTISDLIYHEHVGHQTAFVARNTTGAAQPVQLELLYKALSLEKGALLRACQMEPSQLYVQEGC